MFDIAIVGGGLIGQTLAIALKNSGLKIALIDSGVHSQAASSFLDRRSIALTPKTAHILTQLGVFADLEAQCAKIDHIHVSNQGYFGFTRIHAKEEGLDSLGYVVLLDHLSAALTAHLPKEVTLYSPTVLKEIVYHEDHAILSLNQEGKGLSIQARLVVGADGAQSLVRESLKIDADYTDYEQVAIVGTLQVSELHEHWAYERFTPNGPFALLPAPEEPTSSNNRDACQARMSFVWTVASSQLPELLSCDAATFLARAQATFGYRMGRFLAVGERSSYPLKLVVSRALFSKRAILIGNAAQSLHPVAGQGFNLGLRDVAECAHFIQQAGVNDLSWLKEYEHLRTQDREQVIQTTHGLIKGFSHSFGPFQGVLSLLMALLERCPSLKSRWNRRFMGHVKGARSPLFNAF